VKYFSPLRLTLLLLTGALAMPRLHAVAEDGGSGCRMHEYLPCACMPGVQGWTVNSHDAVAELLLGGDWCVFLRA
jgi:hypothetical protein